jgi:peptidoglycan/LPS O-acetylase OafA/YrhL
MASLQPPSVKRFLYLDSIRALAALYVVFHHASLQYYKFDPSELTGLRKYVIKFFSYGHLSVDLFIVLSGFSLMLAVIKNDYRLKGGTLLFFKRRIKRIIPPYYAAIFVCLILMWLFIGDQTNTLWDMTMPITYKVLFTHLFMVHDFLLSSYSRINYALWSISVEFRIYLVFPLLVWIWRKKGAAAALSFSVVFAAIGAFLLIYFRKSYGDISLISSGVSPYIILFTMGMFAADISFSEGKIATTIRSFFNDIAVKKIVISLVVYIAAYLLVSTVLKMEGDRSSTENFITQEVKDVFVGIFSAFFLIICAVSPQSKRSFWIVEALNWRPLVFVGTFSYSLYLIHPAILQLLSKYIVVPVHLNAFTNTCVLLVIGAPVSLFLSYLFFLAFEKPFLNSQKKRKKNMKNEDEVLVTEINAAINPAP